MIPSVFRLAGIEESSTIALWHTAECVVSEDFALLNEVGFLNYIAVKS
jgi:hypothetical protein